MSSLAGNLAGGNVSANHQQAPESCTQTVRTVHHAGLKVRPYQNKRPTGCYQHHAGLNHEKVSFP